MPGNHVSKVRNRRAATKKDFLSNQFKASWNKVKPLEFCVGRPSITDSFLLGNITFSQFWQQKRGSLDSEIYQTFFIFSNKFYTFLYIFMSLKIVTNVCL